MRLLFTRLSFEYISDVPSTLAVQDTISPSSASPSSSLRPNLLPSALPASEPIRLDSPSHSDSESEQDETEYVYDVYYRALPSVTGTIESGEEALTGGEDGKDAMDVSSLEGLKRIGQLCVMSFLSSPLPHLTRLSLACSQCGLYGRSLGRGHRRKAAHARRRRAKFRGGRRG